MSRPPSLVSGPYIETRADIRYTRHFKHGHFCSHKSLRQVPPNNEVDVEKDKTCGEEVDVKECTWMAVYDVSD